MILNIIGPFVYDESIGTGPFQVQDTADCIGLSEAPFASFCADPSIPGATCILEESDDQIAWSAMAGDVFGPSPVFDATATQVIYVTRTKRYVRATLDFVVNDSADLPFYHIAIGDLDEASPPGEPEPAYLGRFQQGDELPLILQCIDVLWSPDDPDDVPTATISLDGTSPSVVEIVEIAADQRGVEDGFFRRQVFLGAKYATAGRHLVVFKWLDSDGVARTRLATFHLLPSGSADGNVIAMHYSNRPDATYLVLQCDSGRLIRKANPR